MNEYTGTIISQEQAQLAAEVSARLLWVAEVGRRVGKEAEVAHIDDSLLQQELTERQADIAGIKARLGFLTQETSRLRRLAKKNNAAQSQLEKTTSEKVAAQSELKAARARKRSTDEAIRRCRLRAPFAGIVTARLLHAGEWAEKGSAVVAITGVDRLEVQGWVSVSALPFIKPDTTLHISIRDHGYQAQVRTLVPVAEQRSHLYELRLQLPPGNWRAGESVRIAVPAASAHKVLVVPRDALVLRRGSTSLFRIDSDNIAHRVVVTTGIASGAYIEVKGDLAAGDRVVIRGGERLRTEQSVSIEKPGSGP